MKIKKFEITMAVPGDSPGVDADDLRDLLYNQDDEGCAWEVREVEDEDDNNNDK